VAAEQAAEREKQVAEQRRVAAEQAEHERRDAEERRIAAEQAAEREKQAAEQQRIAAEKATERERRAAEEHRRANEQAAADRERQEAERQRLAAEQAAEREREKPKAAARGKKDRRPKTVRKLLPAAQAEPQIPMKALPPAKGASESRVETPVSDDPFSDFRAVVSGSNVDSVFTLMPVTDWARHERARVADESNDEQDEAMAFLARLTLPSHVAGFAYASGCRIRRVRVPANGDDQPQGVAAPVIVSRRALEGLRTPR
jgi:hypothetical protein